MVNLSLWCISSSSQLAKMMHKSDSNGCVSIPKLHSNPSLQLEPGIFKECTRFLFWLYSTSALYSHIFRLVNQTLGQSNTSLAKYLIDWLNLFSSEKVSQSHQCWTHAALSIKCSHSGSSYHLLYPCIWYVTPLLFSLSVNLLALGFTWVELCPA